MGGAGKRAATYGAGTILKRGTHLVCVLLLRRPAVRAVVVLYKPPASQGIRDQILGKKSRSDYSPLLCRMERSRVVYLIGDTQSSERARAIFERRVSRARSPPVDPILTNLIESFEDRREHETVGLAGFDFHRINRYRDAGKTFRNARHDQLFVLWKVSGEDAIRRTISPESSADLRLRCSFSVRILEENYDLFGSFRSVNSARLSRQDAPQVSL
jgi:hypothetical protein